MKQGIRMRSNKSGFSMLQTVLVFPVFLLLLAGMLQAISVQRTDVLLRNATDNAVSEYVLLLAAIDAVQATQLSENLLPEVSGETQRLLTECLAHAGAVTAGNAWLRERILHWAERQTAAVSSMRLVSGLSVTLEGALDDTGWFACVSYRCRTLFGARMRGFCAHIPVRSGFQWLDLPEGMEEEDGLWALNNLERGRQFRIRNGGNLPMGYPVLSSFSGGTATVIRSMDTTAAGWQEADAVEAEIREEIDGLSSFSGTEDPWGKDRIWVRENDIASRQLILVIPEDELSEATARGIDRAVSYAATLGMGVDIRRQGRVFPEGSETE